MGDHLNKGILAVFTVSQILGVVIPTFTNIHSNPLPLFAALLLAPGIAVAFLFPSLSWPLTATISIVINATVWAFCWSQWKRLH
jgi:hypothetical protein